jgi:hypothetical protein
MWSQQLSRTGSDRELRRTVVLTLGWVFFLLAVLPLLFTPHLPAWATWSLAVTAGTGGLGIVYGELFPARGRWRFAGK